MRVATDHFQGEVVPTWTRETALLGAEVTLLLDVGATRSIGEVSPTTPGRRAGALRAPRGELSPGTWRAEPGRGLYQTSWTRGDARYGDGAYHRGIELHWTRSRGAVRAWISAWVLIDGWRRPAAWPVQ